MQNWVRYYLPPILSGFFIGTSYIPFPPWALFFAMVPLWLFWWKESSYKRIFFAGWMTQFILNAIGFHWIAHTAMEFGRMPWPVGFSVLLIFCVLAHLYYPIAGVLWKFLCTKLQLGDKASVLLLPLVFILCERLYPFIFYWHFGYPWLWARFPGVQVAEWVGFFGLNLISLGINALFLLFWLKRRPQQWLHPASLAAVGLFVIVNIAGVLQRSDVPVADQSLRVLAVQGNIGNLEKIQAQEGVGFVGRIVDTYIELTRDALEKHPNVDLVIWPETAFPEILQGDIMGRQRRRLARLSNNYQIELLTGAYQRQRYYGPVYNGLVLMQGDQDLASYQKTVLLAFGEYFPFASYYPKLKEWFPMVSDFGRGQGPTVLPTKKAQIGAQICYEGLFDEFSTDLQKKGAQVFVNVTNDSWFGYPFEPYQHMYMTLARAIENRRPLIRVTNTGISTVILHTGKVLDFSPRDQEWYKVYDVPYHSTPPSTFYAKISGKWPWILLLLIGLTLIGDRIARAGKY
jgi:apolipoprotein N-acyltransferase